jgi:hypothetical protein
MKKFVLVLILSLCNGFIFGQETGGLRGKIIDNMTKQPLVGANIEILATNLGAATDIEGHFVIDNVPESIVKLRITYLGYQDLIRNEVRVVRNRITDIEEIELNPTFLSGETVVVSTGAFFEDDEQPVSSYSYTKEELNRAPGAGNDLFRSIATMPGVAVSSGGEFSAFSVRGGRPDENIIMVDNIPFSKVSHLEGGGTEEELGQGGRFSVFSPGVIQSVKFQAGGFPVAYGRKNASLIDLKVKEGNTTDPVIETFVDITGGEFKYDGPSFIHQNTSVLLSARHRDFNRVLELIDAKDQGDPRFSDFLLKTTTQISPAHKLSLLGLYSPEYFDITMDHVYESKDLYMTSLVDRQEIKSLGGLNWRWLTSSSSYLQSTFYVTNSELKFQHGRAYTDPINMVIPKKEDAPRREDINDLYENERVTGFRSEFNFQPHFLFGQRQEDEDADCNPKMNAKVGIDIQRIDFKSRYRQNGLDTLYVFDQNDFRSDLDQKYVVIDPTDVNADYNKQFYEFAAYAQTSRQFWEHLTVTAGYRIDYNENTNDIYNASRASAKYQINPKTSISLAGGLYFQSPKYDIIAAIPANNDLKYERAFHSIIGVNHYLNDNLKLTAETYYKQFDDLIVQPDRTSPIASNSGKGYSAGIDISLIKRLVQKFYGQVSYSFAISKRKDSNNADYYNSDFHKPHIFNILGSYEISKEWQIAANWQYASGYPTDEYIVHANVLPGTPLLRYAKEITKKNADRLPASHTLNLRVDYRKQFNRFSLVTFIDILNIYGNKNITERRFQERDGKNEDMGFEMLPTFGLKLEL